MPSQEDVLTKMTSANSYLMNKWPDPTADFSPSLPNNDWLRAVYFEGFMALYRIDSRPAYYDYAVRWGASHNWTPRGGTTTRSADNQCAGQAYIELYQIDPRPERIAKIKQTINNMVNSSTSSDWYWIDAIQMAMPVFAKLGTIYGDDRYFEKMHQLYQHTKTVEGGNGLYSTEDHLWWRDATYDPPYTTPNGKDCYWSRGNGWVFAGLARSLDVMPLNAPYRQEYQETFVEMASALVAVQRADGFWNVSLHDPNNYGGKETSGTAFFTFGLAWGVNNGLLDGDEYRTAALRGWNGMVHDALHPNGFLGYVQGVGKSPANGQPLSYDKPPDYEDFGVGAFLLAGSEIYELAGATTGLSGDYNGDGVVDAADYTVWRDSLGQIGMGLATDGDRNYSVDEGDYLLWKAHFGESVGVSSLAGSAAVPEPAGLTLVVVLGGLLMAARRRR